MNELDALTRVALSQPLSAGSFTSQLQSERGFHLTSTTDIIFSQSSGGCKLHALFLFPSDVFVDRYELGQRRQDGVLGSEFEVWGETDLELPVQAVNRRGSALLISLSANQSTLEVPFHLRYLEPTTVNPGLKESLFGSYRTLKSPWPFIYEACSSGKGMSSTLKSETCPLTAWTTRKFVPDPLRGRACIHHRISRFASLRPTFTGHFDWLSFVPDHCPSRRHVARVLY